MKSPLVRRLQQTLMRFQRQRVYYCVIQGKSKWVGMAKLEPFTRPDPNPITETGHVWFEMGKTRAEAYWKITDEMIRLGLERDVLFCEAGEPTEDGSLGCD